MKLQRSLARERKVEKDAWKAYQLKEEQEYKSKIHNYWKERDVKKEARKKARLIGRDGPEWE